MVHHHAFRAVLSDAFLFHAALPVLVEGRLIPEGLPTDGTRERTFARVGAPMVHQLAFLRESFVAEVTLEAFLVLMNETMARKVGLQAEPLQADRALPRLGWVVRFHVVPELGSGRVRFVADFARKQVRVDVHVRREGLFLEELLRTLGAAQVRVLAIGVGIVDMLLEVSGTTENVRAERTRNRPGDGILRTELGLLIFVVQEAMLVVQGLREEAFLAVATFVRKNSLVH